MTTYAHPHTIDDGAGSQLTFHRISRDESGEFLEVTSVVRPGAGPPMHVHHLQDESVTVVAGTLAYETAGEAPREAGPGATVAFPAGVAHRFWNAGEDELRCSGRISPPDNVEYFLTQIYDSTRRSGGRRPSSFDGAWLTRRYRSEFELVGIPAPVRRLVFPLVLAVGNLRGKQRRFADAPAPVTGR